MRIKILAISFISLLYSCTANSSPDGRAKLRDKELSQRIDELEQKQIIILDSIRLLNEKIEAINSSQSNQ